MSDRKIQIATLAVQTIVAIPTIVLMWYFCVKNVTIIIDFSKKLPIQINVIVPSNNPPGKSN